MRSIMKKICERIAVILFLTSLWIVLLSIFLVNDKEYSENENRYLTTKPDISMEDVTSGKFMDTFETYLNDQFPLRDKWIALKTDIQRLFGKTDINGTYLGSDGYLFEKWTENDFNTDNLQRNIVSINKFVQANQDKKGTILIVPTASLPLQDRLPKNAPVLNQNKAFDMIYSKLDKDCEQIDIRPTLDAHKMEYIYYKTDHHWTTLGAYLGYMEWQRQNGNSVELSDYHITLAATNFKGSLYSKVLNRDCAFDEIYIYDIPIVLITEQYLEYVSHMETEDLDVKLELLRAMKGKAGQEDLDILCESLDLPKGEGAEEERFRSIEQYLRMRKKFEGGRLR